jgi:hypothetical protein
MDYGDTQSLHALGGDEMGRLVSIALEEFGQGLNRIQFNDVMLAVRHYHVSAASITRNFSG